MEIDVQKHRPRAGLVFALNLAAVLTWFGGGLAAANAQEGGAAIFGASAIAGLFLGALAAILETTGHTRYLTAIMAKRLQDGPTPASRSGQSS
jgi:cation transporter-like permease